MPTHLRTKIAYNRLRESQLEAQHSQEGFIIRRSYQAAALDSS